MSHKDLPAVQHIAQRNAAVRLPLLQDLEVIDEDDKVVGATLVEDFGGRIVGPSHFGMSTVKGIRWVVERKTTLETF